MLIGDGWAFIHIPKCGGTSVRAVLEGAEVADMMPMYPRNTARHRFHWLSKNRPEGKVFCFVRHPATWLRSYWLHRMRLGWLQDRYLDKLGSRNMNEFIRRVCIHEPGYVSEMYKAYTSAFDRVDVYRMEYGIDKVIRDTTGIKTPAPHENSGGELPPIDRSLLGLIAACEAWSLERFGYKEKI